MVKFLSKCPKCKKTVYGHGLTQEEKIYKIVSHLVSSCAYREDVEGWKINILIIILLLLLFFGGLFIGYAIWGDI